MATVKDLSGNAPSSIGPDFTDPSTKDDHGNVLTPGAGEVVAYAGSSVQSAPWPESVNALRILATTDAHYLVGDNPTAAANGTSVFLKANVTEYIRVKGNQRIAVIQASAGGNLHISYAR